MKSPVDQVDGRLAFPFMIWVGYLFFLAYGSLVPFEYQYVSWSDAWEQFKHIPMYPLGVDTRADWVANVILAIPTGFLTAHLLLDRFSKANKASLFFISGFFSLSFVLCIEFAQLFFPPRTCSLNDIVSQSVGALIGLVLAAKYSGWFKGFFSIDGDSRRLAFRLLEAYLVGYAAFSLFPYDFLFSGAELKQKLSGGNWGWLMARGGSQLGTLSGIKLLFEIILTLPFGLFLGYRSESQSGSYRQALFLGILLGASIEILQFFMASGISEGLSILTRVTGVCGGLALWKHHATCSPKRFQALIRQFLYPLGAIYMLVLLQANGWFSGHWDGLGFAGAQLTELHFTPFYYHYFTSEAKALVSVVMVVMMYAPIGLVVWLMRGSPRQALFSAVLLASGIEVGKLFLQGMHPDPTNVLLGGLSGWGAFCSTRALSAMSALFSVKEVGERHMQKSTKMPPHSSQFGVTTPFAGRSNRQGKLRFAHVALLPLLLFSAYWAITFPTQPILLSLFLSVCAVAIWLRPILIAVIIPFALPSLDLAQWSGRFYLDEFDLLLLVALSIGFARIPSKRHKRSANTFFVLACGLVALSLFISAIRGMLPFQFPDSNSFSNYYSAYNSLRIAKGAIWAFLSFALLRRMLASEMDIERPLTTGAIAGLAFTVGVILWERLTFSGLFNFSSDYRVTGPFSSMHTGGAYIECFLAVSTPFLLLLVLQTKSWLVRLLGGGLLLATTYALMVTFSRNGYMAFGVASAITMFFALFKSGRWKQRGLILVALTGAMFAVAMPIFTGQFAQERIATLGNDYYVRQAHWEDALDIRSPDLLTTLFGMGLGRYPESHYLLSREENHAGTYQLVSEEGNSFLRLVSGSSIYLGQRISVEPQQKYILKLDARANRPDATITIPICEKWLISSFECIWSTIEIGKEIGVWHHFERVITSDHFNASHWYSQRPIKFSLYNGNLKTTVDVDNLRLETFQGDNLLRNGDFSKELDHWLFTADSHLEWHVKSLPISVIFDQGWFGLVAIGLFSLLAIKSSMARAWQGNLGAAALLASFSGFLVVGLFDTLIDAPRFLFLFLMLGGFCGYDVDKKKIVQRA